MRDSGGVGKWAMLLPPSMADDRTAIRDVLTDRARADGYEVSESAKVSARIVTNNFDPDVRVLLAEIEIV